MRRQYIAYPLSCFIVSGFCSLHRVASEVKSSCKLQVAASSIVVLFFNLHFASFALYCVLDRLDPLTPLAPLVPTLHLQVLYKSLKTFTQLATAATLLLFVCACVCGCNCYIVLWNCALKYTRYHDVRVSLCLRTFSKVCCHSRFPYNLDYQHGLLKLNL